MKLVLILSILTFLLLPSVVNAQNPTTVGGLQLVPTYESIGIYSNFSGDDNANNVASLEWRKVGDVSWKKGMDLTVDRRDTVAQPTVRINVNKNQWRGSILGLNVDTEYEVKITFSDPDGVSGTNPLISTIKTRKETDQIQSIGRSLYVSTTGSDVTGDGLEANPWSTIQKAANNVLPGDVVYVKNGTYTEKVLITRSGTQDNYITFRNFGTDTVVIDPPGANTDRLTRGIDINAKYLRIKGFQIRDTNGGIAIGSNSAFVIVEDNFITDFGAKSQSGYGIKIGGLIQDNSYAKDSNVANVTVQRNTIYYTIRPDVADRAGIDSTAGNLGGHVIRNNTIEFFYKRAIRANPGVQPPIYIDPDTGEIVDDHGEDCIGEMPNDPGGSDKHGFKDTDIYGNICIGAPDDAIELDGTNVNTRVWDNTMIKNNLIGISIAASSVGPTYVFRNIMYDWEGNPSTCQFIKEGRGGSGHVYFYHNTIYMTQADCGSPADTFKTLVATDAGGSPPASNIILKNNLFWFGDRYIASDSTYEADYNLIWDEGGLTSSVVKYKDVTYTWDEWRILGQETNGVFGQPDFVDPVNGNFRLVAGSSGIDKAVLLYGFNDADSAWPYRGTSSDIGAFEYDSGAPPTFNFNIAASPSSGTVVQGSSTTTTVTATLTSGTTQSVSFSTSGLPSGTSASFSLTSCNPTCSSTLTISTNSTTPTGTYPITLTATSSITRATTYTLNIQSVGGVSLTNVVDQLTPVIANGSNVSIRIPLNYSGSGLFNASIGRTWFNMSNIRINESGTIIIPTVNISGIYWQANLSKQVYLQFDVPAPRIVTTATIDNTSFYQKNFTITAENSLRNVSTSISVNSSYKNWRLYWFNSSWVDVTSLFKLNASNGIVSFYGFNTSDQYFRIEGSTEICVDNDNDGYYAISPSCSTGNDCNDANAVINPTAAEVCSNGIDENCDGVDDACPPQPQPPPSGGDGVTPIGPPSENPITEEPENKTTENVSQTTGTVSLEMITPDKVESGEMFNATVWVLSPIKATYTLTVGDVKQQVELEAGKEEMLIIPVRAPEAKGSYTLTAAIGETVRARDITLDYLPLFLYVNETRVGNETFVNITVKNYESMSTELRVIKDGKSDAFFELIEGKKEYNRQLKLTQAGEYKIIASASSEGKIIDTDEYLLTVGGERGFDYRLIVIIVFAIVVMVITLVVMIR